MALSGSPGIISTLTNPQRTIRLVDMVDMLIQKSYHDLIILAEVELQRKPDMEKKILIMQYLSRTHNYLVRFLALLKWSSNMSKVEKCFGIVGFLEEQSVLFVETADVLARMARETLANSKLPCYQVSFAIDVLNSKTCPRLPSCIKDRTVREEPLSAEETEETLSELEHALLHRLLTFDQPPSEMRNFAIRRGRVTFIVEGEFEVSLTVMGEDKTMPYRVLDLKILVGNRRVGEGRPLIHPQQILYLIQLIQSRILDNDKPLLEVYTLLHTFCQGLQLEVMYSQLTKHMANSGMDYFRIETYSPNKELRLAYWDEYAKKDKKSFTVTISGGVEPDLQLTHQPPLPVDVPVMSSDMSTLMISLIHARSKYRLDKLCSDLSRHFACSTGGLPALLIVPLYTGAPRTQSVQISVDYYTGMYVVYLKELPSSKYLQAVKEYINSAWNVSAEKIAEMLRHVRLELTLHLIRKYSQHINLQEQILTRIHGAEAFERFNQLGPFKAAFKFQKKPESNTLLVISIQHDPTQPDGVRLDYYIAFIDFTKFGAKIVSLMSRKSFFDDIQVHELQTAPQKRESKSPLELLKSRLNAMKANRGEPEVTSPITKFHPAALDDFSQVALSGLMQVLFSDLRAALKNKGFAAEYLQSDQRNGIASLPIICPNAAIRSCRVRRVDKLQTTQSSAIHVDYIFDELPFYKKDGMARVSFLYDGGLPAEKMADLFSYDYVNMLAFKRMLKDFKSSEDYETKVEFDGKSIELYYGDNKSFLMTLTWDRLSRKLLMDFHCANGKIWNPHRMLRLKLLDLMENFDLNQIHHILQQTSPIMSAIRNSVRIVSVTRSPRSLTPQLAFQYLSLSFSNYLVSWRGTFALYVRILPGPKLMLTDVGASTIPGMMDGGKFVPIVGLRYCLENIFGNNLICSADIKPDVFSAIDADLEAALNRFFLPLRNCVVQLVEASSSAT